jgi:hypothetical protein
VRGDESAEIELNNEKSVGLKISWDRLFRHFCDKRALCLLLCCGENAVMDVFFPPTPQNLRSKKWPNLTH